jgi:hypothetical protein
MDPIPIVCTLAPGDLRARRNEMLPGLVARAVERQELPDGFRWRFDAAPDVIDTAARVIAAEHQCCAFLRFEMTVEPGEGPLWLTVTGPKGTREFLASLDSTLMTGD